MTKNSGVIVTGMGILGAYGQGVDEFLAALKNHSSNLEQSQSFPQLTFPVVSAEIKDFHFEKALIKCSRVSSVQKEKIQKLGRRAPLTIQTSLISALEAWQEAKLHERMVDPTRIGLVIAGQNTTQHYIYHAIDKDLNYLLPSYALRFMDTDQVGSLSEAFGIQGEGFTVGGASASSHVAIIQAKRLIEQKIVDVCLVVGVVAHLSPLELQAFYSMGALGGRHFVKEPNKACRPFDKDHEGFIPGQASASLILESEDLAKKVKIPSLGKLVAGSIHLDANQSADPKLAGEAYVMHQVLKEASLKIEDIQYINTHGTSSILGDKTEIAAIKSVFGHEVPNIWLNSTKSITGHCLWSAGVVEAIATLLQMKHQFVHANLNLEHPIDSNCRFVDNFCKKVKIHYAMNNAFGFGGINTSLIFATE